MQSVQMQRRYLQMRLYNQNRQDYDQITKQTNTHVHCKNTRTTKTWWNINTCTNRSKSKNNLLYISLIGADLIPMCNSFEICIMYEQTTEIFFAVFQNNYNLSIKVSLFLFQIKYNWPLDRFILKSSILILLTIEFSTLIVNLKRGEISFQAWFQSCNTKQQTKIVKDVKILRVCFKNRI